MRLNFTGNLFRLWTHKSEKCTQNFFANLASGELPKCI